MEQIEAQLLDLRFRLRPPAPPSDDLVLVLIDDASIREIGRWPWSRTVMADGIARLSAAGARTIGVDLLLAEPEPAAVPPEWLHQLREALGAPEGEAADMDVQRRLTRLLDHLFGDRALAAAIGGAGDVVLPYSFAFGSPAAASPPEPPAAVAATEFRVVHGRSAARAIPPLVATGLLAPIPELAEAAASLGHTNVALDRGGAARFEFPAVAYGDGLYPSFALEVARRHLGVPRGEVRLELGHGVWLRDRLVPTDDLMRLVVNYRGPGRFRTISFAQVLAGDVAAAEVEGKAVLIGGAAGGIGDTFLTPFTGVMPGVQWRATVVDNILREDFMVRRHHMILLDLGFVLCGGLLIGWLGQRGGLLAPSLGLGAITAALLATNLVGFFELGRSTCSCRWWGSLRSILP